MTSTFPKNVVGGNQEHAANNTALKELSSKAKKTCRQELHNIIDSVCELSMVLERKQDCHLKKTKRSMVRAMCVPTDRKRAKYMILGLN